MSEKDLQDFAAAQAKTAPNGAALSQSMAYGVQQNPDEYARALRLAKKVGISPQIVNPEVHQAVDTSEAIGAVSQSPNVASWFSNHDNASVAHDDIHALTAIEQAAQNGISVGTVTADPRSALRREYLDPALRTAQSFPPTRFAIGAAGGTVGMLGNIASFVGIHGDNGGPNALQRVQQELDPSVTGAATVMEGRHLPFDTISQNVGPLLPAAGIGIGTSAATRALGLSERAQALIGGGNIGAAFTADQGGAAYQQAIQSGKTPQEARQIANRVALINAPANVGLSALSALPSVQKYGVASAIGLGAGMGFSGQVGQNYVEGKPLTEGGLGATVRGAATQLGLHAAFAGATPIDYDALAVEQNQAFFQAIADPAQASKLAKRYGPAFEDAVAAATKDGPVQTVQIAPDKLMQYFQDNKIDPVAGAEDLGIKNFPESLVAGTDAVIPIVKFTSKIAADPKAFEALRGDLRLYGGEATLNEIQAEATPEQQAALQGEAAQADAESKNPQLEAIHEDMRNRLIAAKMDPSTADAEATLWTARVKVAAERSGMTPEELHGLYAPTITRPGIDERTGQPIPEVAVDRMGAIQEAAQEAYNRTMFQPPKNIRGKEDALPPMEAADNFEKWANGLGLYPKGHTAETGSRYITITLDVPQSLSDYVMYGNGESRADGLSGHELDKVTASQNSLAKELFGSALPEIKIRFSNHGQVYDADFSVDPEGHKLSVVKDVIRARQAQLMQPWLKAAYRLAKEKGIKPYRGAHGGHDQTFFQDPRTEQVRARVHAEGEAALSDQEGTFKKYEADPETAGGKIVNGDKMAEIASPTVASHPHIAHAIMAEHGAANRLANDYFEKRMAEPPKSPDETVLILVGNAGAGKSTISRLNADHFHTILDTNGADPQGLVDNINRVVNSGRRAEVSYLDVPIEEAVKRNISRQAKEGRPVAIVDQADLAVKAPASFAHAHDVFSQTPGVTFSAHNSVDMSTYADQAARDHVDSIRAENANSSSLQRAISAYTSRVGEGHATAEAQAAFDRARPIFEAGIEQHLDPALAGDGAGHRGPGGEEQNTPGLGSPTRLGQPAKPWEFGSKGWNEYYKQNKGSLTPKSGDMKGPNASAKERARQFKANKGQAAMDAALEDSARQEKLAYEEYRRQFAAWEKDVKNIQAGTVHAAGENRGFIQFGDDRKFQVGLLQNADLSTFTHETGHLWLEVMGDLAQKEGASDQLKGDYAKVLKFLGVDSRDQITTEQHEKFARANEAYLREGKAPSEGLRGVFQRVKYWMAMIYRNAKDLNVKMNDEIRGVFDRMYASDAEIEQARKTVGDDKTLFTSAKDMGVSEAMFRKYADATERARATATDALQHQLATEAAREKMAWWKDELAKTKEEVAKEVDSDPAQMAFKALTDGRTEDETPIKLNREDLVYRYGEGIIKELPPTFGHLYSKEGGVDADTAADRLGFDSPDQMIDALRNLEPRKQRIDRLADIRMRERHGDLMLNGGISDAAAEALHNEHRADALAIELKALRDKQAEVKPFADQAVKDAKAEQTAKRKAAEASIPSHQQFREAAKGILSQTAIKDLDPNRYLVTQRVKAKEAFDANGKGKFAEAADAKQKELLNHYLYVEARKAKAEADSIQTYAKRVSGDKYRARLGLAGEKVGTNFLAQHDAILDRFDFRRATNKELEAKKLTLQAWVDKMTAEGESPALTEEIINENYRKNYREMTLPELQAVKDALVNIGHLANEINKVTIEGKKVDREQVISQMVQTLARNEGVNHPIPFDPNLKKSLGQKTRGLGRGIDALLIRMEQMFKWADNGDVNGIFHKAIWNPLQKAHEDLGDLSREITAKVQEAMDTMPREMRKRMLDTIDVEGMPAGTVTRKSVLTMLLNMGNDSNFEKLTRGYGISPDAVFKAVGKLSKEEVQWAQHIWDTIAVLKPRIGELERRTTGLEPKWVEVRPFTVKLQSGEEVPLQGGYLPAKYDPRFSTVGQRQLTGDVAELTDSGFSRPSLPNGFTKPRTNFVGPILLDYEQVLLPHLTAVMKDLSHREAVKQAYQLITEDSVRKAFTEAFGEEYTHQLLPWLKTIVNDSNGASIKGLGLLDSGMRGIRRNTVAAAMGFRVSTALVQYTGITRSLHEVGTLNFAKAYSEFLSSPKKSFDWINEVSGEMRNRAQNLDRDFREVHNRAVAGDIHGLRSKAAELAFYGLHLTDIAISYPTWLGKFRQALGQGRDQATAIKEADQAVRLTQPTAAPKDLPAIMRNNETAKLITMFYGHFNLLYQNLRDTGHFVSDSKNPSSDRAMRAAKTALVSLVLPALGEGLFRNPPGEDENYAEWLLLKSLHFGSASVPLIRELGKGIVDSLEGKKVDMKFSPMLETLAKGGKAIQDTHKAAIGEGDATRAIMSDLDAAGYITGVPGTGQAMTTARYIQGRMSGKIPEEGFMDTIHHAAVGYPQGGKK